MDKLKLFEKYIERKVHECISRMLNENRLVTFDNVTYPKFGWCVILAGGGGSGKGFILNNNLPINGKVINVDTFKKLYVRLKGNMIDGVPYDSHNTEQVSKVHNRVKDAGYKDKYMDNIFNSDAHNISRLPNVIFDMTGRNPNNSVIDVAGYAREVGYKTCIVWVVANRHEALLRNLQRSRRVSDKVLHSIHNNIASTMPNFLQSGTATNWLDDAWIIFSSTEGIERPDLIGDDKKQMAIHLEYTTNGFVIPQETLQRIERYLGQNEVDPDNPQTYLSSDEIAQMYGKEKYDKSNNFNGYSFDRTQFKGGKNFYRN